MSNQYDSFRQCIKGESFIPFQYIFSRYEWIFRLIYHEKSLSDFPSETRAIRDLAGNPLHGGYVSCVEMPEDEYSPKQFKPFMLTGIWLPLEKGKYFSALKDLSECPLIKKHEGRYYILFLIHPASEELYQDLLKKYHDKLLLIPALSLSSVRSLLIALTDKSGQTQPVFVKVSLNQFSNGIHRILTERECALSVANTIVLNKKIEQIRLNKTNFSLEIFEDALAYVPKNYSHGMLYRIPPVSLLNTTCYTMPLLALYGTKNIDTLKNLVKKNTTNNNATLFFKTRILEPYTRVLIELLRKETSLEAHGQNLMLKLNADDRIIGLIYRDMGGVNQDLKPYYSSLPKNLRNQNISYFHSYTQDAAAALEYGFICKGLFPLTKQMIGFSDYFLSDDPEFADWYQKIKTESIQWNYLKNWCIEGENNGEHHEILLPQEFYRYGYVETVFGFCLLNILEKKHLLSLHLINMIKQALVTKETGIDGEIFAPCRNGPIFISLLSVLIKQLRS